MDMADLTSGATAALVERSNDYVNKLFDQNEIKGWRTIGRDNTIYGGRRTPGHRRFPTEYLCKYLDSIDHDYGALDALKADQPLVVLSNSFSFDGNSEHIHRENIPITVTNLFEFALTVRDKIPYGIVVDTRMWRSNNLFKYDSDSKQLLEKKINIFLKTFRQKSPFTAIVVLKDSTENIILPRRAKALDYDAPFEKVDKAIGHLEWDIQNGHFGKPDLSEAWPIRPIIK